MESISTKLAKLSAMVDELNLERNEIIEARASRQCAGLLLRPRGFLRIVSELAVCHTAIVVRFVGTGRLHCRFRFRDVRMTCVCSAEHAKGTPLEALFTCRYPAIAPTVTKRLAGRNLCRPAPEVTR